MLSYSNFGSGETTLVLMPFLGGSQREWTETVALLSGRYRCVTVDLPGFGASASIPGYSVYEMCNAVITRLASLRVGCYILVGHSMAGKLSAVVTRRLMADKTLLPLPDGLILVAPSPPGPEPMPDEKRSEMLDSLGNELQRQRGGYADADRSAAEKFVRDNIAEPIEEAAFQRTVNDVLVMNPAAWVAWLTSGSKEDWAEFVGVLSLPVLVVAGTNDGALGPGAQSAKTLPHFSHAELAELDCSHLVPLERPIELAALITRFIEEKIDIRGGL